MWKCLLILLIILVLIAAVILLYNANTILWQRDVVCNSLVPAPADKVQGSIAINTNKQLNCYITDCYFDRYVFKCLTNGYIYGVTATQTTFEATNKMGDIITLVKKDNNGLSIVWQAAD